MTDQPTAAIETAEELLRKLYDEDYRFDAGAARLELDLIRERDALIRAQALREVADKLDITAQECLADGEYADYKGWIDARNIVLIMMSPEALAHADGQQPASESRS